VGIDASASAIIQKNIAIFPTFVHNQRISPKIENAPHTISNLLIFHSAFLLKNDAIKTNNGINPAIKVVKDKIPTPCFISAKKSNQWCDCP
jgi:hypothetical protein